MNYENLKGKLITLEGCEGSGKSTQAKKLIEKFETLGLDYLHTREPGGTQAGDQIRELLLNQDVDIDPITEFLLFSASRAQLCVEVLRPAMELGKIVLCDRFFDSSIAYQSYGRGLDLATLKEITKTATQGLTPDITLLFDINPAKGMQRVGLRGGQNKDRMERADMAFHKRVREGYLDIAVREPNRIKIINADETIPLVTQEMMEALSKTNQF